MSYSANARYQVSPLVNNEWSHLPVPEHETIFGDIAHGIPNPDIFHVHPYPTRYHGPIYSYPRFGLPYRENPYAVPPYAGTDDLGACGCTALGDAVGFTQPLLCASSGNSLLDSALGAAVGYAIGSDAKKTEWTVVGGIAGLAGGLLGIVGVAVAGLYMRNK